ncbi:hypothetical protein SY89_03451 [Halolamina pelagica]|uniref:DUF2332 domain-containing protein n=1 Tax=Halolamina pelagica TaxID=699431 RepID=A0A0P7GUQ6_9EURY|nr:DUF2332 domain-containing protein [Halolamina pelagica]KPN29217.1 hypothetical protein SY89_03451 [Halolamina pelagica]
MDLPEAFRTLADWAGDSSPLYETLCRGIAEDPTLLELAEEVPRDRWAPHVTLSAVHYLLLDGADHTLAQFYPTLTESPEDPAGAYPHFHDFCVTHTDDLIPLLRNRRTQSNAVGRCAGLYPALCYIDQRTSTPLVLLELGASAGLNLNWDRYGYTYDSDRIGATDSAVTVQSAVRAGSPPLQQSPPAVNARLGIDLNPLDPTDPSDAAWLRALVWPEHPERLSLLDAALKQARANPPQVVADDAVETLVNHAGSMPADGALVVYHTALLYQLSEAQRSTLHRALATIGETRPVWWLSGDGETDTSGTFGLELTRFPDGDTVQLGRYEQHGRWIEWYD